MGKFSVLFNGCLPDRLHPSQSARSEQTVLLQFFTQCVAVNAQHLCCVRLIAAGTRHDGLQHGLFDGKHDHFVHIAWLHFPKIAEIFLETFLDDILNIVFAHAESVGTNDEDLCKFCGFMQPACAQRAHIVTARLAQAVTEKMHRLQPAECRNPR